MTELEKLVPYMSKDFYEPYQYFFDLLRNIGETDIKQAIKYDKYLQGVVSKALARTRNKRFLELLQKAYCYAAREDFHSYLIYMEWNREPNRRFYQPRMHYLKPMVQGYQDILDGNLDLLTISQPKRTGKSQTGINFVNMLSGKNPNGATLMEGMGVALVDSFYKGVNEYLDPESEYLFYDVFPDAQVVGRSAELRTVNLSEKSRFPTIMCRSIDATQVGLSEASNLLYLDDLVEGREEALNRGLLDKKWEVISGDVMGRRIEGCPIVAAGTRYSLYDPIGRLQEHAGKVEWRWRAVEIPALDPITDESNYECEKDGKKIFTTGFLRNERILLGKEQWESEFQQMPFESKGILLPEDELNRYFELPTDKDPDCIIAVADPAESGEDSTSMPVAYIYGEDVFVDDVVFDNSPSDITKPQCANMLHKHNVGTAVFESNAAGTYYARDVATMLKEKGSRCNVKTKRTISNKQTRIELAADNIKKHFFFKDKSLYKQNSQYGLFMKEVTTYTRSGKNKHDDAPDSLSLMENEIRNLSFNKIELTRRHW